MRLLPITPDLIEKPAPGIAGRSGMSARLLREPLVHFVVVGAILFGAYDITRNEPDEYSSAPRIELTQDDISQLAVTWLAQGRPAPTTDQLKGLVDQKVTEEILFREAISLGLDRDDQIIKRRLAQKMDFLAADLATIGEPTKAELQQWFTKHSNRFALPPHVSFRHLYFSPDTRVSGAREAASAALSLVRDKAPDTEEVAAAGDPFMFRNYYGDSTPEQVAKELGPEFAAKVFQLNPKSWHGPLQSGYGWHLVWIDSIERGRIPDFDEVGPLVKEAWIDERYREIKRVSLEEMRSRYEVIVPPLATFDYGALERARNANLTPNETTR